MADLARRLDRVETSALAAKVRRVILDTPLNVHVDEDVAQAWARQYPRQPFPDGPSPAMTPDEWRAAFAPHAAGDTRP